MSNITPIGKIPFTIMNQSNAFIMSDSETQLEMLFRFLTVKDDDENFPLARTVLTELHKITKDRVR